jgi:uncharacterized membrane protein
MSDPRPEVPSPRPGPDQSAGAEAGLLLACFDGSGKASKIRKALGKQIHEAQGVILDEVILRVNGKGKALAYNPRRTVAGALTPALTWGVFGLLAGSGLSGLVIWGIIGAVCGGLAGYYLEHALTKNELKRIGDRMPADSSAIAAFVRAGDAETILRLTAAYGPTTASLAAISDDLSARVWSGAVNPTELPASPPNVTHADTTTLVSMVILRCAGQHAVRNVVARLGKDKSLQPEILFEVDKHSKKRVSAPTTGVAATGKSSAPGWALFGLVFGVVAGATGGGGVLSALKDGLVTAIAWGIFGLGAGSLYGLWAGRAISARRLKGVSPLLPPDTSAMIAWANGPVTEQTMSELSAPDTKSLVLRFNSAGHGIVLEA